MALGRQLINVYLAIVRTTDGINFTAERRKKERAKYVHRSLKNWGWKFSFHNIYESNDRWIEGNAEKFKNNHEKKEKFKKIMIIFSLFSKDLFSRHFIRIFQRTKMMRNIIFVYIQIAFFLSIKRKWRLTSLLYKKL